MKLNKISHDDYLRIEGARMMIMALPDFIRKWRTTDSKGNPTSTELSVISSAYDPKKPTGEGNNSYACIKGVTTDMMIEAVQRLTANTFDCQEFIYGQFPEYATVECKEAKNKKGYAIKSIEFKYRKN